jgi:DNA-binding HxlR family transcriptional regulator
MPTTQTSVSEMLEYIIGCKWSMRILGLIQEGVDRPGAITRSLDGLTTKVLNACLHKMVDFDILERIAFPEVPPRVEYKFTQFGLLFLEILDKVRELEKNDIYLHKSDR